MQSRFAVVLLSCFFVGCQDLADLALSQTEEATQHDADFEADLVVKDEQFSKKLALGDRAPDFEVELLGGNRLRLSEHVAGANGPTILLFDRAHW